MAEALVHRAVDTLRLRRPIQALRVAVAVRPTRRYVGDLIRRRPEGRYVVKRTSQLVHLRPWGDLQVARELISKDIYDPPPEVRERLPIAEPCTVVDLGANIGLFTLNLLHRLPQSRVIAVEPDPENHALLRRNLAANGLEDRATTYAAAAGTAAGTLRFVAGRGEESHVLAEDEALDGEIIEVPVLDALALAEDCAFLKVDVEGGEWQLLADPRFATLPARVLALEWHAKYSPSSDPEGEVRRALGQAGYVVEADPPNFGETGSLWAWRP